MEATEARYFEGSWACMACGKPIRLRVYCYRGEDANIYTYRDLALERHECPIETSCSVEPGDVVGAPLPVYALMPEIPAWDEMTPSQQE